MGLVKPKDKFRERSCIRQNTLVHISLAETPQVGVHSYYDFVVVLEVVVVAEAFEDSPFEQPRGFIATGNSLLNQLI